MKKIYNKIFFLLLLFASQNGFAQGISGSWSAAASSGFTPRAGLTSAALNGKIYVMGGFSDTTFLNTLEVYDPKSDSWSTPITTGTFSPRRGLCSAVVRDKIYVIGGYNGKNWLNTLEVFDPAKNTWTTPTTTGTYTPREKLCCSVVNDKIYVIGGFDGTTHFNIVEVFDPAANTWANPLPTGTMTPRRGLTSSVINNKIYVMGGYTGSVYLNTLEVFDPLANSWGTPTTTGTFTARGALSSSLIDGKIYTMAGVNYTDGSYHNLNIVEVFDPVTKAWTTPKTTGTFSPRQLLASSVFENKIYALGGSDGIFLNTNEVFMPSSNSVHSESSSPEINIFPNPTTGILHISSAAEKIKSISIHNLLGENIMGHISHYETYSTLDLSKLQGGIYYLRIAAANSVVMRKIVKQ